MSLLLDALRRAEEARRAKEADSNAAAKADGSFTADKNPRAQSKTTSPPRDLALEDTALAVPRELPVVIAPELAPAAISRDDLALEELPVQAVEPDSVPIAIAHASRAGTGSVAPKEITQRDAARNVFAAKQPSAQLAGDAGKRKWMLPIIAGIVLLVGAGGWYVWNEINRVSQPLVARAPQPAPLPPAAPNTGQFGNKPASAVDSNVAKVDEAPIPSLLPPPVADAPTPKMSALPKLGAERVLTDREALAKKLREAPVAKETPLGLKLASSIEPPKINPELTLAYQSLASGNYAGARNLYAKLVLAEPLNVDAQLGLATAEARSGNKSAAMRHYRQVLALDPRNGLAIVGLIALNEGAPPAALEIELKTLIGRNPDAAPLHFALGNLYASEQRWTEAQQAYFEAFRIDAENPDYLFNLAVSLDQLRQTKLALDYYRKADGVATAKGGGQFDRNVIATRIKELSGETGRHKSE